MVLPDDRLKELLIASSMADPMKIEEAYVHATTTKSSFPGEITDRNILSDEQIGRIVAGSLRVPFVSLSQITIPEAVFHIIPEKIARKYKVVAFDRGPDGIKLAMAEPKATELLTNIVKKTNERIAVYYATDHDIDATLHVYKKVLQKTIDELLQEDIRRAAARATDDLPIAKIVDTLMEAAYQDKASDVHIEPEEEHSLVRFRIDGVLHDTLRLPKPLHDRIVTRIKVLSGLRTDEHLTTQDGKFRMTIDHENLDIRVSILPVVEGEKVVMRLLSARLAEYSLSDLGMSETDLEKVTKAYNRSYGMILSTGPTGSGKTTTIYSILRILNTRDKNITTVEDPVEYRITGANQVNVNPKTNLTFAAGLRSILRQDPNIIFVGEIRDNETAGIAVNAALTGHLVLSTLHTNDAATAIPRLSDMKVEPFLVASTVNLIIAQRLLRKICEVCKTQVVMSAQDLGKHFPHETIARHFPGQDTMTLYEGKGCKNCHYTGYAGRLGVYEVLEVTKDVRQLIADKADSDVIAKKAIEEGMNTMMDDGLIKVRQGMTTIEEVIRVTKVESQ